MKKYTVLMLLPDTVAENYGEETYLDWTEAETPKEAIAAAQKHAAQAMEWYVPTEDFFVLFACEGHHVDLNAGLEP